MLKGLFDLLTAVVNNPAVNDYVSAHADSVRASYTQCYIWSAIGGSILIAITAASIYVVLLAVRKECNA